VREKKKGKKHTGKSDGEKKRIDAELKTGKRGIKGTKRVRRGEEGRIRGGEGEFIPIKKKKKTAGKVEVCTTGEVREKPRLGS